MYHPSTHIMNQSLTNQHFLSLTHLYKDSNIIPNHLLISLMNNLLIHHISTLDQFPTSQPFQLLIHPYKGNSSSNNTIQSLLRKSHIIPNLLLISLKDQFHTSQPFLLLTHPYKGNNNSNNNNTIQTHYPISHSIPNHLSKSLKHTTNNLLIHHILTPAQFLTNQPFPLLTHPYKGNNNSSNNNNTIQTHHPIGHCILSHLLISLPHIMSSPLINHIPTLTQLLISHHFQLPTHLSKDNNNNSTTIPTHPCTSHTSSTNLPLISHTPIMNLPRTNHIRILNAQRE